MPSGRDNDVAVVVGSRVNVGLSSIIGITVSAGQLASTLKWFSGGSLEVGVTAGGGWGAAYLMGTSEILNMDSAGTYYLAATGATAIVMLLTGKSSGS